MSARSLAARWVVAAALVSAAMLGGCSQSASIDEIAPAAANRRAGMGPLDTGTYPNLNIAPRVAATSLTDEERDAKLASLRGAQQRQGVGLSADTSQERQRRLKLLADQQRTGTRMVVEEN